jgi:SAM-dependent methyltransferase
MNEPPRERQSLATGFRNVDTSGDTDACARCLDLIAIIPFFHKVKRDSIRIIADAGPKRVLDAGCGTGTDLAALASCLPGSCEIAGLDASGALLARAVKQTAGFQNRCSLVKGDILHAPFHDSAFGACRIDRVLQHLDEPARAIHELTRILAPGGVLVVFDNDWDTFSIGLDSAEIAARIGRFWRGSFASGTVGRDLSRFFRECGLAGIHAEKRTLELMDLSVAERVFDLPHLLARMERAGALETGETAAIRRELLHRDGEGTFVSGYTGYLVWGRRPE